MLAKAILEKEASVSFKEKTVVVFKNNFQFTLVPNVQDDGSFVFDFEDIKGDFEITKIACYSGYGGYCGDYYHKDSNTLRCKSDDYSRFRFTILANAEFKEVNLVKVEYRLQFPSERIVLLDFFDCYSFVIKLPGYDHLKFDCHIRKYKDCEVSLVIENPYNLRLNGKKGNYESDVPCSSGVDRYLSFIFDPATVIQIPQTPFEAESRPDSVLLSMTNFEKEFSTKLSLGKILLNMKYADVFFISSDRKRLPSYKCVMAEHSKILAKCFEDATKIRTEIICDKYDAKTIAAALDFCHGKVNSFEEKEPLMFDILKFAYDYEFTELQEACCTYFEETVNVQNVCEIIQIAYTYNLGILKQKCQNVLNENKAGINAEMLENLPKNILIDLFRC